jgi:predicted outer membrane repeat protein
MIVSNSVASLGGGLFLESSDSLLANNIIQGNGAEYGGGLAVYEGHAELNQNEVISNQSSFNGGGVLFVSADGSLVGNIITGNVGQSGGGASLSGDILVTQNTISWNSGSWGGGLALGEGIISLISNTITDNRSSFPGGGVAIDYFTNLLDPNRKILADNIISRNASGMGGGLFFQSVRPVLMRNLIQDNTSEGDGGGIYANDCQVNMDGDVVTGNTAQGNGGGLTLIQYGQSSLNNVILADNQSHGQGSSLFIDRTSVDIAQATIANNIGETGIYVQSGLPVAIDASRLTMTNTIVASHTVAISASVNSTVTLHGVLWFGNETMISGAGTYIVTDMTHGDPAFTSGGYRLSASSAAIDSGVPSSIFHDIDLQPRPYIQFDLGADEFWPDGVLRQIYLPIIHLKGTEW